MRSRGPALVIAGAVAALLGRPARGQFGGYEPPAPICPAFKCGAGEKAVGKPVDSLWSYGCKESGMSFLNTASFDPNNPLAGMNKFNLNKCCVEKDICKQTCGMTSKACHEKFQACSKKVCKGDQNCQLQASVADMMAEPYDEEPLPDTKDGEQIDWKKRDQDRQCKGYTRGQKENCKCVPTDEFQASAEHKLKAFYGQYNPEKLGEDGEIKNVGEVWDKWKGKEPDMFLALATKYKDKTVQMKEKPKRDYTKDASDFKKAESEAPPAAEEKPADSTEEDLAFEKQHGDLKAKMKKAAKEEDFDAADAAKDEIEALLKEEEKRLKAAKSKAIDEEDYAEAKRLKLRLEKLEL